MLSRAFGQVLDLMLQNSESVHMHRTESEKSNESRYRSVTLHSTMLDIAGFCRALFMFNQGLRYTLSESN